MEKFEDRYLDVLQNIEMTVVEIYRRDRSLLDYDVDKALNVLCTEYRNERPGGEAPEPKLGEKARRVYDQVRQICEWRLGRSGEFDQSGFKAKPVPISVDEIIACLKRIRKSVDLWNKQGGRQGYLYFIDHNID